MGSSSIQLNVLTFPIISHFHHPALQPEASMFGSGAAPLLTARQPMRVAFRRFTGRSMS